jgi:threonine dehydrogenase-like Zn-dependent dehydrogenase
MRALVFDGLSVKYRGYHPDPAPAVDQALIQVNTAGICHTDIELAKGYMGFKGILGHEFVGTVLKSPDDKWIGKRVVGEINCVCGKCDMCHRGLSTHCFNRSVLGILNRDGAFADYVLLPARNLHLVPDNVANEEAVFVEPLAAALQVLRQVPIDSRAKVTILGDGRLGQLVAQVVQRTSCKPLLVGRHPNKLAVAERLGILTALEGELQPRRDQDVVIDCTGRAEGLERAIAIVRPRGTIVLKTTVAAGKPLNMAPLVIDEITVLGSRCGPFRDALSMLAQKQVDVTGLVSRRVRIDAAEGLFSARTHSDGLKVLITFDR